MGMYDEVAVPCPTCRTTIYFQSKAGPRQLKVYSFGEAPPEILADLEGTSEYCERCQKEVKLALQMFTQPLKPGRWFTEAGPRQQPGATMESVIDVVRQARAALRPVIYYATSDAVSAGKKIISVDGSESSPPFIICHPNDLDGLRERMPLYHFVHLRDVRPNPASIHAIDITPKDSP